VPVHCAQPLPKAAAAALNVGPVLGAIATLRLRSAASRLRARLALRQHPDAPLVGAARPLEIDRLRATERGLAKDARRLGQCVEHEPRHPQPDLRRDVARILQVILRDERVDFEKRKRCGGTSDLPLQLALEAPVERVALPVDVESIPLQLNAGNRRQETGATRQAGILVGGQEGDQVRQVIVGRCV
jgi:hypothetical protein